MAKAKQDTPAKKEDDEVLARIRDRFELVNDIDGDNRRRQREDTEFVYTSHTSAEERAKKKAAGDPCLEFPQLKQFVSQVVNDQRQNRPGIRIHPQNDEASEEVAEILQGLVRGIEYDSRAEAVYDCGYQHSVVGGRGYWRIISEYERPDSFYQRLKIGRIADPMTVWLDPNYQEPDGSDRGWGFVTEDLHKDVFKERYPKADPMNFEGSDLWFPLEDHIRIADYYERVSTPRTLVQLADGTSGYSDEVPPDAPRMLDANGEPVEREVMQYSIAWYTVAGGQQVLEKHEWPGTIIPIVCTMGDEIIIDGKRVFQGLISQAKDAQKMFDFGMNQQAITLQNAPRSPFVGPKEAFAGFEPLWKNANKENLAFLPFNAFTPEGEPIPAPQRSPGSQPDAGWMNWSQQMTGLIRSTIGMYENSLGMKGQEVSGKAITARERQGDNATFHFQDNLARAIALTGRILVECIPTYYDTQRIVHLIGPDDEPHLETINQQVPNVDPMTGALQAIKLNDVTSGQYAVTVEAGPGYATKRQEMAELLMNLVQAYPPIMQIAPDIIVGSQDIPEADRLAKRLKATLPPPIAAIAAQEDGGKGADQTAQLNAQLMQAQQQIQQMQQAGQALQAENAQLKQGVAEKQAAAQADAQAKVQAANIDANVAVEVAKIKADADVKAKVLVAQVTQEAQAQAAMVMPMDGGMMAAPEQDDAAENKVLMALAQAVDNLAQATAAPRAMEIKTDAAGNVIGGISKPIQ